MKLNNYMDDGASRQAVAVLAFIRGFNIEESWNDKYKEYGADIMVARWENCREQGYVLSLRSKRLERQINIAFFEHRNSDSICAVKWEQVTMNSPTIDTADFGGAYKDKWDTSKSVGYGEVVEMSEWIKAELSSFWNSAE